MFLFVCTWSIIEITGNIFFQFSWLCFTLRSISKCQFTGVFLHIPASDSAPDLQLSRDPQMAEGDNDLP